MQEAFSMRTQQRWQSFGQGILPAVLLVVSVASAVGQDSESSGPSADPFARAYEVSKTAHNQKQYTEIIELCERGLAGKPPAKQVAYARKLAAWAYNRRGELFIDAGQEDEAMSDFVEAVKLDKTNWRALHNRGVSHAARTEFAEAAADFEEVIKLKPDFASVWFNRGELRSQNSDFTGAVKDYDEALKLETDDPAALVARGHAYYQLGKLEMALDDYNRSLELDKQRAVGYLYRAAALAEMGRFGDAADDYRAAVRLEPKSAASYQAVAWMMATCPDDQYRDAKLALKAARKAIELRGHDDYRDLETLAAALAESGQFEEAAETEAQAIALAGTGDSQLAGEMSGRLKTYRAGQAYHEQPQNRQATKSLARKGGSGSGR
jgi:tetratricopeptide (TPR) repeat protein